MKCLGRRTYSFEPDTLTPGVIQHAISVRFDLWQSSGQRSKGTKFKVFLESYILAYIHT